MIKYRVTVGTFEGRYLIDIKDFDFVKKNEAQSFFEQIDHTSSLWRLVPLQRPGKNTHAWIGVKWKRVKNGVITYLDY